MKKVVLFNLVLISLFMIGCSSNKRVVCDNKVSVENVSVDISMIADFKSDKINKLSLQYTMDLSGYNDTQIKTISELDMCSNVKSSMKSFSNAFNNCKQNIENKKLIVTADFDINKLTSSDIDSKTTKEEFVNVLEKQEYVCK